MFAAIGDTPYNIMLFLHILTGFVAFAPAFTHPILAAQMERAGMTERPAVFGLVSQNSMRIYGSALIVSGLLGFGVAGMSDEVFKVSQGWLVAAVIIWIAMNGLLHAGIIPAEKAIAAAGAAKDAAAEKKLTVAGQAITVLFLVQLYIMIWKPGL
jgi:uncharacterized membrane protein